MSGKKPKERSKLIKLPIETIEVLDELAKEGRTRTKPYMEKVLIDHAKEKKQSK